MNHRHTHRFWIIALAALSVLTAVSCKHNLFDEDEYIDMAKLLSPVDSIEAGHGFRTTATYDVTVETATDPDTRKVQILSGNPAAGEACYVLGSKDTYGETSVRLFFSAPVNSRQFYAALINSNGEYTIARFSPDSSSVSMSSPVARRVQIQKQPVPQIYTYCFEDEQPEIGNYDYNDLVLRISQERIDTVRLLLNITISAVGCDQKISAAMRLAGYSYNDIDSVSTVGITPGETFDDDYELSGLSDALQNHNLLQPGLHNEAIIRLFEDAHWATGAEGLLQEDMSLTRIRYNVSKNTGENYDLVAPRTITYTIKFKSTTALETFTLDCLDPFLVKQVNGGYCETHLAQYQGAQLLYEYTLIDLTRLLPWAIVIPNGTFRYPLQGYNMGYRKDGYLFGTYMTFGHAFGEWVEDHTKAIDWYDYPTLNMAF